MGIRQNNWKCKFKGGQDMRTMTMAVEGMHCQGCEVLVKEGLEELDGVEKADVSHASGTLTVVYDEGAVTPEAFRKVVEDAGYRVSG